MNREQSEILAAQAAAYDEMSAGFRNAMDQYGEGDVLLSNLQHDAQVAAANLALVQTVVAALPRARSIRTAHTAYRHTDRIAFEAPDVPAYKRLMGSILWAPAHVEQPWNLKERDRPDWSWPHYVVGSHTIQNETTRPRLLLVPAMTDVLTPAIAGTFAPEINALDEAMRGELITDPSEEDVRRAFRPTKEGGHLEVGIEPRSFLMTFPLKTLVSKFFPHQEAKAVERMARTDGKARPVYAAGFDFSSHYNQGISAQDFRTFNVAPRLAHLAMVFGKTELLAQTLHELPNLSDAASIDELIQRSLPEA
jgi:hypothetical protein